MLIRVLGPVDATGDDGLVVPVPGDRARTLLAVLAANAGQDVAAGALVEALWPDTPPVNAGNALQAQVSRLRRLIGRVPGSCARIAATGSGYRLDGTETDAMRFAQLAADARDAAAVADWRQAAALLTEAERLWRGAAYGELAGHPTLRTDAARLEESRLTAAEDRHEAWLVLGRHADALSALRADVARHPLRERLWVLLIRALYAGGRQADALAAYEEARRTLAEELGVDPGPELRAVQEAVLRQELEVAPGASVPGPVRTLETALPTRLTSFVGRQAELGELARLLDEARLVTVTGPGGAGKTSLALSGVAVRAAGPGTEVAFVDLGSLPDGDTFHDKVAQALGVDLTPNPFAGAHDSPTPVQQRLLARLTAGPVLLILDNCEHVLDVTARFALDTLTNAPAARILATSREPLGVPGEQLLLLGPLPEDDAVQLFVVRARAVDPSFTPDAVTEPLVRQLVRRLDGIPLAVELAASRVRALSVEEITERLDDRFRLLTGGSRTALPRQRTLAATVDWSYDLLIPQERTLFEHCALLPGGISVALAEAVAADAGLDPVTVFDLLARLVDRSLLIRVPRTHPVRYRMLDTFRAYGADRLNARGELDAAWYRLARALSDAAAEADHQSWGPEENRAFQLFEAEFENLRAAWTWAARHAPDVAARIAGAMGWFGYLRGHREEVGRWLREAMDLPVQDRTARAHVLKYAGFFAQHVSDLATAVELGERALELFSADSDDLGAAEARLFLAMAMAGDARDSDCAEAHISAAEKVLVDQGESGGVATVHLLRGALLAAEGGYARAWHHLEQARTLFEDIGNEWGAAYTLVFLAVLDERSGDYVRSTRRRERVLEISTARGLHHMTAVTQVQLGTLAVLLGRHDEAVRRFTQGREVARSAGVREAVAYADNGLGLLARRAGDPAAAIAHHTAALEFFDSLDNARYEYTGNASDSACRAAAGLALALAAADPPDLAQAEAMARRALEYARKTGSPQGLALSAESRAAVAAAAGDGERAAVLLGVADALRSESGMQLLPEERTDRDHAERLAVEQTGAKAFAAAYRRGAACAGTVEVTGFEPAALPGPTGH